MARALIIIALAALLVAGTIWYLDLGPIIMSHVFPPQENGVVAPPTTKPQPQQVAVAPPDAQPKEKLQISNEPLYPPAPDLHAGAVVPPPSARPDPIVISGCNLTSLKTWSVPSPREGRLLFVGTEVDPMTPDGPGIYSATIDLGEKLVLKKYRELQENVDIIEPGQMVALVDPAVAQNELETKQAKISAAIADHVAAQAMHKEAEERLKTSERLVRNGGVTPEDYRAAILARDKYREEEKSKLEAVKVARIEANQALILLKQHTIRNTMPSRGVVKTIFKKTSEAVKSLDPVMQLYGIDRLRAEGLVEVQYYEHLRVGMKAIIEPQIEQAPLKDLQGPRGEITSVAITSDEKAPLIVAGSVDRNLYIWIPTQRTPRYMLAHPAVVRTVVCSPREAGGNWCLSGCDDGSLRLWDLNKPQNKPVWETRTSQRSAITALAFSPNGQFFATGSEDNTICLWDTNTGNLKYTFDADHGADDPHQGTITSLHFTPQCRLVSASRDGTLRIWSLHSNGVRLVKTVTDRGGTVTQLGVSPDGRWTLFDKGRTLHLLSLPDGITSSLLQNPVGAAPFETLALFSPDSSLLLTAGAPEGRLQLWRAPMENARGYEVRQFVTPEKAPVTCAAFGPQGQYVVSGTKDGIVYIWNVPTRQQVEEHPIRGLTLSMIEQVLDANNRQVRIGVDVTNPVDGEHPYGRLRVGKTATVVIER